MTFLWISHTAFEDLTQEANRAFPMETGGVLVGYFAENGEPVVHAVVGPGPAAIHRRYRFTPDHAWQCGQLDVLFEQSEGLLTYVGDWHTHPDGVPEMSWLDHWTLRRIAKYPEAGTPQPLMLIGGGVVDRWQWTGHQFLGDRILGLVIDSKKCKPRLFSAA